jgi:hypothetical protein
MLCGLPPGPSAAATSGSTPSLTPLILFAASPGTITGVITLSVAHGKSGIPLSALVAVAVATTVMWLSIVLVARLGGSRRLISSAEKRNGFRRRGRASNVALGTSMSGTTALR